MRKSKPLFIIVVIVIIFVVISLLIPKETKPSSDTRIILEHNYETYIAPSCFQEADATNFIEDSTLGNAQSLNYSPNSSCTNDALKNESDSLFISLLKDIGIVSKKWDTW